MHLIGQRICLWQVGNPDLTRTPPVLPVLKKVMVTITETKTGVPGEFSRKPVSSQSLRGIGDDGKIYEKHWQYWPESQTDCFTDTWSIRDDGAGEEYFWNPREAVYVYNFVSRHFKRTSIRIRIVGLPSGVEMKPEGDITYCEEHDRYWYLGTECLFCHKEKPRGAEIVAAD